MRRMVPPQMSVKQYRGVGTAAEVAEPPKPLKPNEEE